MADLFATAAKADVPPSPEMTRQMRNAAAVHRMVTEGLFNGTVRVKAEHEIRSSSGRQSILAGPGLAALDVRPLEARKETPAAPLHPRVKALSDPLPPQSAALLSLILTAYETSKSEPVSFRIGEVAKHFHLPEDAAEQAVGVLINRGLIARHFDNLGAPAGWRPTLPTG